MNREKVLLVGKQFTLASENKVGGVITLFELLKEELDNYDVDYEVLDLNWRNYPSIVHAYCHIVWVFVAGFKKSKYIFFNGTAREFFYLAPLAVLFGKVLRNRIVVMRKFAGNFDELYDKSIFLNKYLVNFALRNSTFNFFETLYLVKRFKEFNKNTYWFPNVRKPASIRTSTEYKKRFIFLGQVKKTKGISEIISVFSRIADDFQVDIYGPLTNDYSLEDFDKNGLSYKGVIAPEDAAKIISEYDVLLLPSYHAGEGYPGVIIEAYSVGVPVVGSNMRGIKEIVDSECGVIVEPKSEEALESAVRIFTEKNYPEYSNKAFDQFANFNSSLVTSKILTEIGVQL